MMDCEQIRLRVDELVDGEMPPDAQAALRRHLAGCAACDRDVRAALDLRARLAALPARVSLGRDLWPEIAARIATRNGVVRPVRAPRIAALAAAVGGIAVAALVAVQLAGSPAPLPAGPGADRPAAVVVSVDPGLHLAAQSLLDAAEHGGGNLPPETVAVVRDNLELIDRALREIALALEMDPDNPHLQRQLLQTYRGQAELVEYIGHISTQQAHRTDL